jgi:hypothetical protein
MTSGRKRDLERASAARARAENHATLRAQLEPPSPGDEEEELERMERDYEDYLDRIAGDE